MVKITGKVTVNGVDRPNPVAELAGFFGMLSRIFSDPAVQETGQKFFDAVTGASDRELGIAERHELERAGE